MSHAVANVRSEPVMHPVDLATLKSPENVNVKSFRELSVTRVHTIGNMLEKLSLKEKEEQGWG